MNVNALLISLTSHLFQIVETNQERDQSNPGSLIEPDPIRFSFDTSGWYLLGGVIFVLSCLLLIRVIKNYRKNAYRRDAIEKLGQIENINQKGFNYTTLNHVFALLKIVAFETYGRHEVAAMHGSEWLTFLESKASNVSFNKYEEDIYRAVYKEEKVPETVVTELISQSKKWIQTHA